ncbi:hypothetical protein GUITHDRAFT_162356 [Guillardia theta CCMP2712]|uniref:Uncharacterized protein n=2 Tax=Guillardia theta TaxID=55529 RepID=L1JLC0_GUITC|nr:hypothetical protein GUITHDRAFT_162356 [Guillardia theta CCMP2712]EKX48939.1 hypothetical protein GUITHDRAFT_162356 [Guillardia theta CCMP2712]|mmetsp:Transcript_4308/g.15753  ORF Transcript_4308/g.15753 Transcript_4308/m.15753 type:complete len:316 (+) Transcript_4308:74-1021(+)|eukprot:XP_005835919.1 hypothetical protein GUITHDRAFT_162356 [Guillardia theta CCMP2712]
MGDSSNAAPGISGGSSWNADGPGGSGGGSAQQRGVYWKRNDSMRLVHLLIDPELKPAFISMESQSNPHRSSMESNVLSYKQFWAMAAQKFNDEDWQPPHLFPNDPHLARCRAFTPSKKSKEVDPNYLREKYKALRRQFNNSVKRWEEGGHSKIENFWKCSGMAPGTSDEGCWYMFLVLWVGKHEDVLAVVLDKHMDHSPHPQSLGMFSSAKFDLRERVGKRQRSFGFYEDFHDYAPELQMEMKMESIFKQQAEALKFISMCFANLNEAMEDDQRAFWRNQLSVAQAQLNTIQNKLPQPSPPPPPNAGETQDLVGI